MNKMKYAILALIFVLLFTSSESVLQTYKTSLIKELQITESAQLSAKAVALQSVINRNFNLMVSLEAYVNSEDWRNKDDQQVHAYLEALYTGAQASAFNLIIAPQGIMKYVFPKKGNESIINWNLLTDPRQNVQEQIARGLETRKMTTNGPFKLLQGINGLVARKAIYQNGSFWGFVSVAINVDHLLLESGILWNETVGLQLAIRTPGMPAFFGDNEIFVGAPMTAVIDLQDTKWEIAASPSLAAINVINKQILVVRCAILFILILGLIFILYILRQRDRLSQKVNERTQELQVANDDLTAANEELIAGQQELQESTKRMQESEKLLSYMAYHDVLTGIHNRAHFQTILEEQIASDVTKHTPQSRAVLFFDLDNFKMVNDSHGHHTGDSMLQEVVHRVQQSQLKWHTFARFGGDEFAILLEDCANEAEIEAFCEGLIDVLKPPCVLEERSFFINISIGIVQYPKGGTTWDALLKNADIAMYMAKKESGSSYTFFDQKMAQQSILKLEMGNHLRQSLERNELEIVYQPQIDCEQGKIVGVEALLRWNHTNKGYISPSEFIPLSEELGLIVSMGEWVLRGACWQMKEWHNLTQVPLTISVNISVKQLSDERFVDKVIAILAETGLEARYLEMEITENVAMQDEQIVVLHRLRELGIAISVDDFGTHYSSLSYLKRFPVTKIKLDQSFVRDVQIDGKDRAMIKAIISVANAFQLQMIAEGVETEEQASFLVANGCNQIQGYYFYKPMRAEQLQTALQEDLHRKFAFMEADFMSHI
ncbi:bifunctional diguanylate cyclase/phosphodiesterase [Paenibacillus roseipurpureus]|uniref:EAL domain-containing protein n=1 Tax=Paenibacillus roseopurpureus TaxID=2918901 RepID=A0AA96RLR5_9BACL|nr:EAL domain-containing protein [Paenibacillus sp. MBLB1832]WNR45694.1 EAL domain-containing protein [Paenibacillus sp. MBLB1832]